MTATTQQATSAVRWGPRWGSRPDDWAATEEQQLPTYDEAIRRLELAPGRRVLEVGCGSGVFLRAAADRGAVVTGLDASAALLERARARVPEADLRHGDLHRFRSGTTPSTSWPASTSSSSRTTWSRRYAMPDASRGREAVS